MGRGDKKTKKGKISKGSYGVSRPRLRKSAHIAVAKVATEEAEVKEAKPKKAPAKKTARKKASKD
jgi:30S ribosomal protein S31